MIQIKKVSNHITKPYNALWGSKGLSGFLQHLGSPPEYDLYEPKYDGDKKEYM